MKTDLFKDNALMKVTTSIPRDRLKDFIGIMQLWGSRVYLFRN